MGSILVWIVMLIIMGIIVSKLIESFHDSIDVPDPEFDKPIGVLWWWIENKNLRKIG